MTHLKKCPFCGNDGKLRNASNMSKSIWLVCCENVHCCGEAMGDTPEQACEAWNRRAEDSEMKALQKFAAHIQRMQYLGYIFIGDEANTLLKQALRVSEKTPG